MRRLLILFILIGGVLTGRAQYNVDRLMTSGQIALHHEDYVLSIQYFNQVILLKPYLYQPWQLRAAAKFYLDDFMGAEADATEAIKLNPYLEMLYDLRAISRIRQKKYQAAIADYNQAIRLNPMGRNYWFNRAICHMDLENYDEAQMQTDTIIQRWSTFANAYALKAELYLHQADTVKASQWLDKSLEIDPYDGNSWMTRAHIALKQREWKDADKFLTTAIHLKPKVVDNYLHRALARLNYNNLRGAMSDYDAALDLDPDNFLGHYNRGLLRMQLGDDNRAITDFDFVIKLEPENMLAIFNRGQLRMNTGDLSGAISDFTSVINEFPNFWTGLSYRAKCYRMMGQNAKADLDEFRILKAQMDKHVGVQNRWSKKKQKEVRKRSEIDPEKYNQIVVEDEPQETQNYKSEFRGRVQNKEGNDDLMPMYELSLLHYSNGVKSYQAFDSEVDDFNRRLQGGMPLMIACNPAHLTRQQTDEVFNYIDRLSDKVDSLANDSLAMAPWLLQRAVAFTMLRNPEAALMDLATYLQIVPNSALAYWQRTICHNLINDFKESNAIEGRWRKGQLLNDMEAAIHLHPQNPYLYYNRGNYYASQQQYAYAIDDYTRALKIDPSLAEAYYNRGIVRLKTNLIEEGISDLSKAGELGLYSAYGVIKRHTDSKK